MYGFEQFMLRKLDKKQEKSKLITEDELISHIANEDMCENLKALERKGLIKIEKLPNEELKISLTEFGEELVMEIKKRCIEKRKELKQFIRFLTIKRKKQ